MDGGKRLRGAIESPASAVGAVASRLGEPAHGLVGRCLEARLALLVQGARGLRVEPPAGPVGPLDPARADLHAEAGGVDVHAREVEVAEQEPLPRQVGDGVRHLHGPLQLVAPRDAWPRPQDAEDGHQRTLIGEEAAGLEAGVRLPEPPRRQIVSRRLHGGHEVPEADRPVPAAFGALLALQGVVCVDHLAVGMRLHVDLVLIGQLPAPDGPVLGDF
mmetsp:Transcript_16640/g.39493  ORF Transcript_16640/g.39493 Transcript_16640/m.39493 type:complete len:217 (-) Transcript_16640:1276-1926(-)